MAGRIELFDLVNDVDGVVFDLLTISNTRVVGVVWGVIGDNIRCSRLTHCIPIMVQ